MMFNKILISVVFMLCGACIENNDSPDQTSGSDTLISDMEISDVNPVDRICQTNKDCLDTEICVIADIHGYKCKPIEDYDYKIIITHYEPFESCPFGFIYFTVVNTGYKSTVKNCPFSWEEDYFIYKLNDPVKISFLRSDPFEDLRLGAYCFNMDCLSIPTEIIHEGKFFGFDDKNYGRIMGKIVPYK